MSDQLALLTPRTKMEADFERFHLRNPEVYDELVRLARQARAEGHTGRIGLRMLWEVMRWNRKLYLVPADGRQALYRLNDHYCPYYARYIMDNCPDLADAFEVRRLRSGDPVLVDHEGRRA